MWMPNTGGLQSSNLLSHHAELPLWTKAERTECWWPATHPEALLVPLSIAESWTTVRISRLQLHKWVVWIKCDGNPGGIPWWEKARYTTGKKQLWLVTYSHCNRLKSLWHIEFRCHGFYPVGRRVPKPSQLGGCYLTPRSRHRASTCWVRDMTYPWGNCSHARSSSKGCVDAVQGWTSEPSLNFFNMAFVWIKSRRQRATECRRHLIKVLARLPHPCHIPSQDTSWLCSPAATLALFFWIHVLRTAQFPLRWEKPHAAGVKHW